MHTATPKPDDLDAVRAMLKALVAENRGDEAVEAAVAMLGKLRSLNTELLLKLAALRREQGGRRSEKIDPAQLSLLLLQCNETIDAEPGEEEESTPSEHPDGEVIDEAPPERKKRRRKRIAPAIPRVPGQSTRDTTAHATGLPGSVQGNTRC